MYQFSFSLALLFSACNTKTFNYSDWTYHFQTCSVGFFPYFYHLLFSRSIYYFFGASWLLGICHKAKQVRKWCVHLTTRALIILVTKEPYYHQSPKWSQKTSTSICTQIHSATAKLFHADRWPDTTKLTVIFHKCCANVSKSKEISLSNCNIPLPTSLNNSPPNFIMDIFTVTIQWWFSSIMTYINRTFLSITS